LVCEMKDIYTKAANINNIGWIIDEEREGYVSIWLTGKDVKKTFENEWDSLPFVVFFIFRDIYYKRILWNHLHL
jgi:hypothetical protein